MAKDLRSTVFKMMEQDALKENIEVSKKEMDEAPAKNPKYSI